MFGNRQDKQDVRVGSQHRHSALALGTLEVTLGLSSKRSASYLAESGIAAALVLMTVFVSANGRLLAQGFPNNNGGLTTESTLIEPPREMQRLLDEARENVDRKVWSEATLAAGILLGLEENELDLDWAGQDYFLDTQTGVGRRSIRQEAVALLDSMPEAGQSVIELRYGVQAQRTLDDAITNHDWRGVEDVARQYSFTKAGREAAWLVVEQRMGKGLPMDAAIALQQLMELSKAKEQFGVGGPLFLSQCWMAAGREDLAIQSIELAKSTFPKSKISWKGAVVDLSGAAADILRQYSDAASIAATAFKTNEPGWVGGDLQRNADSSVGLPVPLTNWKYWMHESVQHEDSAYKTFKQKQIDRNSILVPSRVPVIAYPWVIVMSYGQRINAIHLKTGKMAWGGSFNTVPYDLSMDRYALREGVSSGTVTQDYLVRRIWGESAIGQLSTDGTNLYCLAELPTIEATDSLGLGIHANVARPVARGSFNCLQALSIAEQGKLVWEVGGATGIAEPALAGVLFLGTPIEYEDALLTIGELNGEVYLFAISPTDGHLLWRQQLVANNLGPLASDPRRRNQSCVPSVSGGLCVCPTLSGQLIAVNLNTRSLVWSLPYDTQSSSSAQNRINAFGSISNIEINPMEMRSSDAGVLISGDCVIHAPSDGDTVYAANLLNGELRWELSKNSILYVACGWKDRVLLVGDQLLYCVDANTGKNAWESPIPLSSIGRVVGRGCRNGDHYFVPMSNQEILDVDLREGKIVERMRVALPLGNLVSTADQIISLSPIELATYSIRDRVRAEVDLEFAAGNVTSAVLQRKSKIHLAEGNLESAIDAAEKAYRIDRDDPEVQQLLRYVALRALQEDFDKYSGRIDEYESLISTGLERKQYLMCVIDGLVRRGESVAVTQKLLELQGDMYQRRFAGPSLDETIDPETNLTVQNDVWIAAKLAQLYDNCDAPSLVSMANLIETRLADLSKLAVNADSEARSDMFRWLPLAESLRVNIARKALDMGDLLLAEQLLEEASEVSRTSLNHDSSDRKAANVILATEKNKLRLEIYNSAGRWTTSVPLAVQLGEPLASVQSEPTNLFGTIPMRRSKSLLTATTIEDMTRLAGGVNAWPEGKVNAESRIVDVPLQSIIGSSPCPIKQSTGTALEGWLVYLQQGAIELVGPTGTQRLTIQAEVVSRGIGPTGAVAHLIDSILLLELPTEIVAVDTLRAAMINNNLSNSAGDCVLWRESLASQNPEDINRQLAGSKLLSERTPWGSPRIKNRRGFLVGPATRYGVIVAQGSNLISLDPRTGTRRWTRSGFGNQMSIAQDGHTLIVIDAVKSERLILDARDGRLISSHPIDGKWEVWISAGKNILTARAEKSPNAATVFNLIDGVSGEVLLDKIFPADIRAEVLPSDGNYPACLVTWQANQPLTFWNLTTGIESQHEVTSKIALKSISLERIADRILILPDASKEMKKIDMVQSEENERFRKVSGPMLAIDPKDGHSLWESPVIVHDYRFAFSQVRNSPAIILTRALRFKVNDLVDTETSSLAVLDNRNGDLVYYDNYLFLSRGADFQCMTKPGAAEVIVQYRGSEVELKWTDEPDNVPPMVDSEKENSSEESENKDIAKEVAREVGKIDRKSIQSGIPAKLLERLQSGDTSGNSNGRNADYDQLYQQEEDQ